MFRFLTLLILAFPLKHFCQITDSTDFQDTKYKQMSSCGIQHTLTAEAQRKKDSLYFFNPSKVIITIGVIGMNIIDAQFSGGMYGEIEKSIHGKWSIGIGYNSFGGRLKNSNALLNLNSPSTNNSCAYFNIIHRTHFKKRFVISKKVNYAYAVSTLYETTNPNGSNDKSIKSKVNTSYLHFIQPEIELFRMPNNDNGVSFGTSVGYRFSFGKFNFANTSFYNYPYVNFNFKLIINFKKTKWSDYAVTSL